MGDVSDRLLLLRCGTIAALDLQCQVPYFVATKMSKIRKASLTVPSPAAFAAAGIAAIGACHTV